MWRDAEQLGSVGILYSITFKRTLSEARLFIYLSFCFSGKYCSFLFTVILEWLTPERLAEQEEVGLNSQK